MWVAGGCVSDPDGSEDLSGWRRESTSRQKALDQFLAEHQSDYLSYKDAPLTTLGIPLALFRVLPEIFPEYWGSPGSGFSALGFAADDLEPGRELPLGLGVIDAQVLPGAKMKVVGLTCAACHLGRVIGPTGAIIRLIGGTNNTYRESFTAAMVQTVSDPRYVAASFTAALARQPPSDDPDRARLMVPGAADAVLAEMKRRLLGLVQRSASTIGTFTYAVADSPSRLATPGYVDVASSMAALSVDPAALSPDEMRGALPPAPSPGDIMVIWRQRERSAYKWDGLGGVPAFGNLGAELIAGGGVPSSVNIDNAVRATRFTADLPPPSYPFDVDGARAARGQLLFADHCASCHHPLNAEVYPTERTGTDANRAAALSSYVAARFLPLLRAACPSPEECEGLDVASIPDGQLMRINRGYMALPLTGVWAAAPYLHNGSVPTLRQLLTGERPAQFYRGNASYDQDGVGFVWDRWSPGAMLFDTTRAGLSNRGHDRAEFLGGVDWKHEPEQLADLLEYLKTL